MERFIKHYIWGLLGRLLDRLKKSRPYSKDLLPSIQKILVIRPDRLGDVILSIPVYETIKVSLPQSHLTVLVQASQSEILRGNPFIDCLLSYEPRRPWKVCGELLKLNFDLAIVLNQIFSGTAALFSLFSGAFWRTGYAQGPGKQVFNILVPEPRKVKPEVLHNLDVLNQLGIKNMAEQPLIYFNATIREKIDNLIKKNKRFSERNLVLIKPGTRLAKWGWDPKHFQTVSHKLLTDKQAEVFYICGPGEDTFIESLAKTCNPSPVPLPPLTSRELAYLIEQSNLLICNHTGIMHLASAVQTPVLAIFKHGDTTRWGPFKTSHSILEERDQNQLKPETVVQSALSLLP